MQDDRAPTEKYIGVQLPWGCHLRSSFIQVVEHCRHFYLASMNLRTSWMQSLGFDVHRTRPRLSSGSKYALDRCLGPEIQAFQYKNSLDLWMRGKYDGSEGSHASGAVHNGSVLGGVLEDHGMGEFCQGSQGVFLSGYRLQNGRRQWMLLATDWVVICNM